MRSSACFLILALLLFVSAVSAQTTSPRTATRVFDLQTSLAPVSLGTNTQYVSGTGIRLTASATSGTALYSGITAPFPVNNVVPSWNLDIPDGTGYRTEVRAVNGGTSTIWYEVARQGYLPENVKRDQSDKYGDIEWDTLVLNSTWPQIEYRVTLYTSQVGVTPTLRLMSICYADTNSLISYTPLPGTGTTASLPVPWRSQYWVPDIGPVICGPTSLSMALDYYGCDLPTETVAADCYDDYNHGYGNWPLIAQAGAKRGFKSYTFRANGQQPLRDQFTAGNAVIMSMAYSTGELTNSPISSTSGHLVLMVGVTATGDYICNDPAGADSRWDHVVYNANQIAHVWLYHAGGVLIAVMPNLVYGRYPYYTYQSAAPIVTDTKGKMYVFARGMDGSLYVLRQMLANGSWSAWAGMEGSISSEPVTATNNVKGNTVFARFSDSSIYYRMQTMPNGGWTAWAGIGGEGAGKPAVGKSPDGRLDVFSRMANGTIQHCWEATGGGWQAWQSLGGNMSGDPVVALTWEGRQEVYARGVDDQLYWCYQINDGSWSGWSTLGGPIAGQPVAGRASDGRTEIYCRFADGSLRYRRQSTKDVGTAWGAWTTIPMTAGSDPVLARPESGLQEMFYTDIAGQVMRNKQTSVDGGWGSWESLGGTAIGAPIVGHHDDGRLQVFIFQADGRIWGRSQTGGTAWDAWTPIGAALFSDVTPPVVDSVQVTPALAASGDDVSVTVGVTDNVAVQSVSANGVLLAGQGGGYWSGAVQADSELGPHQILVEVRDTAGNVATNSQHGYSTAPVFSLPNRAIFDAITLDVQSKYLFMIWGKVSVPDTGSFMVDDGSGMPVTVYAANHGLTAGRYVIVRGILSRPSAGEASLITSAELIQTRD